MSPQEIAQVDAKLEELRGLRDQIAARIKQLEEAKAVPDQIREGPKSQVAELEAKLLKLSWKEAASKKCEYVKDTPAQLLEEFRKTADTRGELQGEKFHYVVKADGAILRFKRKG